MINKKNDINYEKRIINLQVGDHILDDDFEYIWIIDEIYQKYDKYCKCHLRYIGSYSVEEDEIEDDTGEIDYYDKIKYFSFHDIAQTIKDNDDRTFDLETAFKEVLCIE